MLRIASTSLDREQEFNDDYGLKFNRTWPYQSGVSVGLPMVQISCRFVNDYRLKYCLFSKMEVKRFQEELFSCPKFIFDDGIIGKFFVPDSLQTGEIE